MMMQPAKVKPDEHEIEESKKPAVIKMMIDTSMGSQKVRLRSRDSGIRV